MKKSISVALLFVGLAFMHFDDARQAYAFNEPPFDFLFGNHIDTHQQTRLLENGGLFGFLYIIFPGATDPVSGLPIARHPRGASENEECGVDVDCTVGWVMRGRSGEAKFLYHSGVNGNDHPVWMINRVQIPQPGSYTHFHWIADDPDAATQTTDPRAGIIPFVCNQQNAGQLQSAGAADETCPGWFLQLLSVRSFAFEHGGEIVAVRAGFDNATHLNLVTNYDSISDITPTR